MTDNQRNMQVRSGTANSSAVAACKRLVAEGGVRGLYHGLGAASMRVVPMAIVSFGTYEFVRLQYTKLEEAFELSNARAQQRCLQLTELQGL
jgi:solute carrier family 25 (mitochondrial phosphate transporter), member 23/24/25/41